jgi:hypothetical protein
MATLPVVLMKSKYPIRQIRGDRIMKRNILKVALPIALVWISALQASSQDDLSCSNDLLTGSYGFVLNGTIVGVGPLAIVGVAKFDGAGNWSRHETAVINGRVLLPESIVGTYQVNADCTGSTADAQGHHSQFVIVNHGKEILSIGTDVGAVNTITLKKQ